VNEELDVVDCVEDCVEEEGTSPIPKQAAIMSERLPKQTRAMTRPRKRESCIPMYLFSYSEQTTERYVIQSPSVLYSTINAPMNSLKNLVLPIQASLPFAAPPYEESRTSNLGSCMKSSDMH